LVHNGILPLSNSKHQKLKEASSVIEKAPFGKDLLIGDFFAGTGSLGFEALSRGASGVFFLESCRKSVSEISHRALSLGCSDSIEVISGLLPDSLRLLKKRLLLCSSQGFDRNHSTPLSKTKIGAPFFQGIFLDPPYALWDHPSFIKKLWDRIKDLNLLAKDGVLCCEHSSYQDPKIFFPELSVLKVVESADRAVHIFKK
jgi:16S rRNA G966 N2-methylase RsmD